MRFAIPILLFVVLAGLETTAGDSAKLPLGEGTVARVTDKEFVVKMKNENAGEVAYPLSEVSRRVRVEASYLKQVVEAKPDGQYPRLTALTHLKPADIKPGTVVKMSWGFASLSEGGQKLEEGHYYQAEIQKLPD